MKHAYIVVFLSTQHCSVGEIRILVDIISAVLKLSVKTETSSQYVYKGRLPPTI